MSGASRGRRIERLRALPFRLELEGALAWGRSSRLDALEHVLVEVTLDDGAVGFAEAPPRPTIYGETVESIVDVLRGPLAEAIVGRPLDGPLPAFERTLHRTAHGALDMAAHHALAVSEGVPLRRRLRAERERVRVSTILGLGDVEQLVEEATSAVERGVRVLKVKVGEDWPASLDVLRRLRSGLGAGVDLYVDANETFPEAEAARRLGELRELGVLYCEEPLPVDRAAARKALRSAEVLPLIADDSAFDLQELEGQLELDTFDVLNLKPARTGFTESLEMLRLVRGAHKRAMVGSQAGSGLGAAHAAVMAARAEVDCPSELGFQLKLTHDVLEPRLEISEGWLDLAQIDDLTLDRGVVPGLDD